MTAPEASEAAITETADPATRAWPLWQSWLLWAGIAVLYFWWPLHLDYYPDEGYFAEMTARMMRGELPNIDFANNYLGGLYIYNMVWFKLLGKSLWAMRMGFLFLLAAIFVPVTYQLARYVCNRFWAAITTLLMMTMTLSINATVSGNWYAVAFVLLAFWIFFTCCTTTGREKNPRFWTLIGALIGIAFLMKHTVAIYGSIALFISWLLYLTQHERAEHSGLWREFGKLYVALGLMKIMLYPLYILWPHMSMHGVLVYIVPAWTICIYLGLRIWKHWRYYPFSRVFHTWSLYIIGFLVPSLAFLMPYWVRGPQAVRQLVDEVLIRFPALYMKIAFIDFIPQLSILDTLTLIWFIGLATVLYLRKSTVFGVGFMLGFWALLAYIWQPLPHALVHRTVLALMQVPVFAIALGIIGAAYWLKKGKLSDTQFMVMSLWLLGVFLYLNTYPLGAIFYSFYVLVPVVFVLGYLGNFLSPDNKNPPVRIFLLSWCAYLAIYGVLFIYRQIDFVASSSAPLFPNRLLTYKLPGPHGGTTVTPEFGERLAEAAAFIRENSGKRDDVFVFSDLPVLYFLTDHNNPTRYSYEMDSYFSDGSDIIADLDKHNVQWVLVDPSQKNFSQRKLHTYMETHYVPAATLKSGILVFKRK